MKHWQYVTLPLIFLGDKKLHLNNWLVIDIITVQDDSRKVSRPFARIQTHGGQNRDIYQVWLQSDAGLESYQPL